MYVSCAGMQKLIVVKTKNDDKLQELKCLVIRMCYIS